MASHPAFHAVADIEDDLKRSHGLAVALYQLIGEEVDKNDPEKHEAMLTVCIAAMEAIDRAIEKFRRAFEAAKNL